MDTTYKHSTPSDEAPQLPNPEIAHAVDKPLRVTPRILWAWEAVADYHLDPYETVILLHIAWRARYGSWSCTHEHLASSLNMHEKSVRRRLNSLIAKGLLMQRKTFAQGNTYYPIGQPWPYTGIEAQLELEPGTQLELMGSHSGLTARNDTDSQPGHSGLTARNDTDSQPGH